MGHQALVAFTGSCAKQEAIQLPVFVEAPRQVEITDRQPADEVAKSIEQLADDWANMMGDCFYEVRVERIGRTAYLGSAGHIDNRRA